MRTIMNAVTKKNIIESFVDYGSPKIWYWQITRFAARGFNFIFHIVVLDVTLQLSLVFNLSRYLTRLGCSKKVLNIQDTILACRESSSSVTEDFRWSN